MRLICPNCGAQYEVSADVVPENGRDVQCSNCGHTWFQLPEGQAAEAQDDTIQGAYRDDNDAPADERVSEDDAYGFHADEPAPAPQRQAMSDEVSDILRQEAEYEAQRRSEEGSTLESQPDLGLEEAVNQQEKEAKDRLSRLRGDPTEEAVAAAAAASRRDLLPDIEEINSSLRSSSDRGPDDVQAVPEEDIAKERRSGFRFGFFLILILVLIAVLVYIFAPQIIERLPNLSDQIQAYVNWVNDARLWLNGTVNSLMASATSMINGE